MLGYQELRHIGSSLDIDDVGQIRVPVLLRKRRCVLHIRRPKDRTSWFDVRDTG
jgi:hypothetical protein